MSTPAPASSPASNTGRGWIAEFLLLGALWGSAFLFMRLSADGFGAVPTAAMRTGIAALMLMPLMLARGGGPALVTHWKPVMLMGVVNSAVPFACFSFALLSVTTGVSAILNATSPLFGAVVAWLWLADRPNASRITGLVIGFGGVALLAWDKTGLRPDVSAAAAAWAVVACLVAALCYGLAASYAKRYLSRVPSLVTAAGSQVGATLGLALPALWLWPDHTPGMSAWLGAGIAGVFCTGIAYTLYFRLIEKVGPAKSLAVTFLTPVFAVFFGAVFLSEAITAWMLLSSAVILVGTALSTGIVRLPGSRRPGDAASAASPPPR